LFSEFSGDGKPEYTLGDAKIKLIDGRVEPKMAHCYVLV
jgi:hypothetical protein